MEAFTFTAHLYKNFGIALQVWDEESLPYCTLSVNIPDALLKTDEFCVNWDVDEDLAQQLLATGRFKDTGLTCTAGHAVAAIWRLVCPELLEHVRQQRDFARHHVQQS
ncbi:TPA: hypothetical protein NI671_005674 [Pseudomonas aeruginosa]|uniref:Uncharacterized protein n=1 Tax=Pseudomonas citronellolis TaxID=53408 RepID=A0A1A9KMW3_9PSED|nr:MULTISPECIES: hypothetical protein [Pseudomonas aeruginosa group]ANI18875.1 hypothetical protein A9C11_33010 [Pseudomonas citronellolis]MBX6700026.1 hypothetical protein [Pseudomonas aeruginosa]MCP9256483.1 hypothetical protein [Pseudomonas aeruginosa]MCW8029797.1 hypothetical protein [Pseudomonas aeruginosa]WMX11659.1 hypothetical protein RG643_33840 [Pseudomonas aeruginosa]